MYQRQPAPPDETDFRGGSSLPTDRYVWGQDVSGSLQGAGGVGGLLLGVTQPSDIGLMANMGYTQAFCFLYDANGNVTDTVNEGGGIMGQYRYDGFGNLLGQTRTIGIRQTGVVQGLIDQPFGFSTKWVDSTDVMPLLYAPNANHRTLAYYGYRHYAPQLGRWINRDPIGEQGGLNLYGMVGNDPVGRVDVLGTTKFSDAYHTLMQFDVRFLVTQTHSDPGSKESVKPYTSSYLSVEIKAEDGINDDRTINFDDRKECSASVKLVATKPKNASEDDTDAWNQAVKKRWNKKFKLCCKETCCKDGIPIYFSVAFHDEDSQFWNAAAPIEEKIPENARANTAQWNIVAAAHEFGHFLGNTDEYGITDGVDYEEKHANDHADHIANIMRNSNGQPEIRHLNKLLSLIKEKQWEKPVMPPKASLEPTCKVVGMEGKCE